MKFRTAENKYFRLQTNSLKRKEARVKFNVESRRRFHFQTLNLFLTNLYTDPS